jgi:predicted nucleotidyltransferase
MSIQDLSPTPSLPIELETVVQRLREAVPQLTAIILFGSQASGSADDFSDYDLIVLVPGGIDPTQRRAIQQQLQVEFPSLHLDLVIGSERALLASLPYEPTRRFWLENGIALWGRKPTVETYPQLAKGALLSHLNIIESEIGVAHTAEGDHTRGRVGVDALEHLLQIEHVLSGDYRDASLRQALANLAGRELMQAVRDPEQPIDPAMIRRLFRLTRDKLRTLRRKVAAMPENDSDRAWREQWGRREPTKAA